MSVIDREERKEIESIMERQRLEAIIYYHDRPRPVALCLSPRGELVAIKDGIAKSVSLAESVKFYQHHHEIGTHLEECTTSDPDAFAGWLEMLFNALNQHQP